MLSHELFRREMARMSFALDASPNQPEPSDERIAQLYDDVKHLDDLVFVASCDRCRKELDWFPKARHILERARLINQALGAQPTALDAWGQFRRKITLRLNLDLLARSPEEEANRVGLSPLELRLARRLGGLSHLAQMPPKDLDWKAKEFTAIYDEMAARHEAEDALVALEPSRVPLLADGGER